MDLVFFIHLCFTFTLLTIPFWPIEILKYGVYVPLLLSMIWLFFGGCPLTKLHKVDSGSYSQDVLSFFIPNASEKLSEDFNTFILLAITVYGFYRLQNNIINGNNTNLDNCINKIETN